MLKRYGRAIALTFAAVLVAGLWGCSSTNPLDFARTNIDGEWLLGTANFGPVGTTEAVAQAPAWELDDASLRFAGNGVTLAGQVPDPGGGASTPFERVGTYTRNGNQVTALVLRPPGAGEGDYSRFDLALVSADTMAGSITNVAAAGSTVALVTADRK